MGHGGLPPFEWDGAGDDRGRVASGRNLSSIAATLQRARSTVMRELVRNGWRSDLRKGAIAGGYRCVAADRRARVLAGKARLEEKLKADSPLWKTVLMHLEQGLSPVQIARILARMDDPIRLSHETIYTALYAMPRGHLRAEALNMRRHKHKARRTSRASTRKSKSIPDMTLIDQRPSEVAERLVPGHWEGDLIIGKGNLSQVGVLIERHCSWPQLS
jgi:transposase, IS30 family